jgi:DNA ligase-1
MRFADVAAAYERLEATSKRGEIRAILVELIRAAKPEELPELLYFSQGLLRPEYEGVELGVADSLVRRAVAAATGATPERIAHHLRTSGDLGSTVAALLEERPGSGPGPTLGSVYRGFREIADASGEGSQEAKVQTLTRLLTEASPVEAKYIARFAVGQLRLGVRELTILDALSEVYGEGTKEARARIEGSFNACSDLGLVAETLAEDGLEGLDRIRLTVGRPIRPMLAERSTTLEAALERMKGRAALEYKYDGLRVQVHLPADGGRPMLFSRRLENISAQFPELLVELPKALRRRPAIVEGECVSIDADTGELQPFQEISRRRGRKYDLERMQEEVPVRLFLFDLLLEGEDAVAELDFPTRRERLAALVKESDRVHLATQRIVEEKEDAQGFFDQAVADGCEGVMVKSLLPGSRYRAGARGFWWIKYKREYTHALGDTIDGVVVGGFFGRGRRAGLYGALLMAAYDEGRDRFPTFCKVGSGFDDALLAELPERLRRYESSTPPSGVETGLSPDVWFEPHLVLELRGAELSLSPVHRAGEGLVRAGAGFALRFPRFTGRFRDDKSATEATTVKELLTMYRGQVRRAAPEATSG